MAAWASHFSGDNLGLSRLQDWEKIVSESIVRRDTVLIWGLREECSNDPPCVMFRYAVIPKRADFVQTVPTFPEHSATQLQDLQCWMEDFDPSQLYSNWAWDLISRWSILVTYDLTNTPTTCQCWYLKSNKAPQLSLGWSESRVRGII